MKQHFQLCYLITILRIFTTPTNSGYFINVYQTNPISGKQRNVQAVNTAKSGSLVRQLSVLLAINCLYQCLLDKSYQLKTEKCSGSNHSKIKIIGLAAVNVVGNKLPMFVIGKAKNPRCFKNIKKLSCTYRSQRKSWMDSVLFEKFQVAGRKVALIIDNCPAHPIIENLPHVKLVFCHRILYQ